MKDGNIFYVKLYDTCGKAVNLSFYLKKLKNNWCACLNRNCVLSRLPLFTDTSLDGYISDSRKYIRI